MKQYSFFAVLIAMFFALSAYGQIANPPAGIIETVAGNNVQGFSGDGGLATNASIGWSSGIAIDSAGNIYIADTDNYRVRKVSAATGLITTLAGNGSFTVSGLGGPATAAGIGAPVAVAVDNAQNVYILTLTTLSKVSASNGTISLIAGTGEAGFAGDGGPATAARFDRAYGVAVDSLGNIYIADSGNDRIRKISPAGDISTVAGTGEAGFAGDGGPATSAQLNGPDCVAVDRLGNVFFVDMANNRVREISVSTGDISTVAGPGTMGDLGDGGSATSAFIGQPYGIALDQAGNLYLADSTDRIREVTIADGKISTIAGNGTTGISGDFGPAVAAQIEFIYGVAVNASGYVYILQSATGTVRAIGPGVAQNPSSYAVNISSSDPKPVMGESVTLTAKVMSNFNLPAINGTVSWFNGSTSLGESAVDAIGNSSIIVALPNGGTQTITATYEGTPGGFGTLALPVTGVGLTGPASSLTIASAGSASMNLSVNAYNGFTGPVDLSCSGLPVPGSCTLSQSEVDFNNSLTLDTITVSLKTGVSTAHNSNPDFGFGPKLVLSLLGPLFLFAARRRASRFLQVVLLVIGITLFGSGLTGCGGKGVVTSSPTQSSPATASVPAGTYTVTVVARSSAGTTSYPITLTVQ